MAYTPVYLNTGDVITETYLSSTQNGIRDAASAADSANTLATAANTLASQANTLATSANTLATTANNAIGPLQTTTQNHETRIAALEANAGA